MGAANTLARSPQGWHAECTDVDGIVGGLAELNLGASELSGARAAVVGAGGTARAALVALARLGVAEVDLLVRAPARAQEALSCGRRAGLTVRAVALGPVSADVAVSTVPASASRSVAPALARCAAVLDVIYAPWPTPVARAVRAAGGAVVGGHSVLLHQAYGQVELFTGTPAPREAMADALRSVAGVGDW